MQRNPFSKHLLDAHPTAWGGGLLLSLAEIFAGFRSQILFFEV
jgi:hypothetical protein